MIINLYINNDYKAIDCLMIESLGFQCSHNITQKTIDKVDIMWNYIKIFSYFRYSYIPIINKQIKLVRDL